MLASQKILAALAAVIGILLQFQRRMENHNQSMKTVDITFVTDRVAIMGNFYENDTLSEVRAYLKKVHDEHHTIYNLSSEPEYNIEHDIENVHCYPFNANNPCALKPLVTLCTDIDSYLSTSQQNVVLLHCRTGKKRVSLTIHIMFG